MSITTASLFPDKPKRQRHEARLQETVMKFLDVALPAEAIAHHSPGEGKRSKGAQVALRRSGYKAGWPDILVIYRSKAFFIELKAPHGRMSPAQKAMQKRLIYAGADVCLCRSVEQVEASLLEIGVPLRGRMS